MNNYACSCVQNKLNRLCASPRGGEFVVFDRESAFVNDARNGNHSTAAQGQRYCTRDSAMRSA